MRADPTESRTLAALSELVRRSVERPTTAELERGLDALRGRASAQTPSRAIARRWAPLVAIVLVCCLCVAIGVSIARDRAAVPAAPALSRIEGGKILEGGYLSESDGTGIKLFFDEGSTFVLSPGTRGRLRVADAEGVRLAVEHGTASLVVVHNPGRRWSVEAGPFVVTVRGTDFSVSWDPADERFELDLRRGRVTVSGPVVGDSLSLRTGQKLSVSLPKAETVITEERADKIDGAPLPAASAALPSASPPSTSPSSRPTGEPGSGAVETTPPSAAVARGSDARRWREALSKGAWDEILAAAEREGVDATLEHASSDDLMALSDAARYRRRLDLSKAALVAQRRRFPSSPRSIDALFLLGRVEELRKSGRAPALAFYDEYLSRAPAGTYAAEALGRKMILTKEATGPASARAIADEYLRRFPRGSYAGAARALQRAQASP
jgi:ferric-dicitrate binding protein FerR (iron transport regulator)